MDVAIEVKGLSKQFGNLHAVRDVSFSVRRGEVLGFLGPNGAGKSTTMKMIAGFLEPSSGSASVGGHDVVHNPLQLKAEIGYLPEGAPSYAEMTTLGFLEFIADIRGLAGERKRQRIAEAVRLINLDGVLQQRIETLSKGFKRRVGVAQAIIHDPDILILDEPTDGLDPNQKHEVRTLIKEMAKDKAIIISTHILEEVDAVCDRVIIIANGTLVFSGTPAELSAKSRFHNAISLTVQAGVAEQVQAKLTALAGVSAVETAAADDQSQRLLVIPAGETSIAAAVSEAVRENGWYLQELQVESGRLDEVFREVTGEQQTTEHSQALS